MSPDNPTSAFPSRLRSTDKISSSGNTGFRIRAAFRDGVRGAAARLLLSVRVGLRIGLTGPIDDDNGTLADCSRPAIDICALRLPVVFFSEKSRRRPASLRYARRVARHGLRREHG
jgi:hypothetical protein